MASFLLQRLCLASALLFLTIYIPLICFFLSRLLRIRHHPVFRARLSNITVVTVLSIILYTLMSAIYCFELGGYIGIHFEYAQYAAFFMIAYSMFVRFCLYHYQIQYQLLTNHQEWKSIIDDQMSKEMRTDWVFTRRDTFGSARWLCIRFWMVPILVGGIVLPVVLFSLRGTDNIAASVVYFVCLVLLVAFTFFPVAGIAWIIVKLDVFNDVIYVVDEFSRLKWLCVLVLIGLCLLGVFVTTYSDSILESGNTSNLIVILCMEHFVALIFVVMVYFNSWWVTGRLVNTRHIQLLPLCAAELERRASYSEAAPYSDDNDDDDDLSTTFGGSSRRSILSARKSQSKLRMQQQDEDKDEKDEADIVDIIATEVNAKKKRKNGTQIPQGKRAKLEFILSNSDTLDLFMLHLKNEFQDEILLSIIEFTQFNGYVTHNVAQQEQSQQQETEQIAQQVSLSRNFRVFKLSEKCPYSSILKQELPHDLKQTFAHCDISDNVLQLQYMAHLLVKKYIETGEAQHEINISLALRKKLSAAFSDMSKLVIDPQYQKMSDFEDLFSPCLDEQYRYCIQSLLRFKQTESWARIKKFYG